MPNIDIRIVSNVKTFRKLARSLPSPDDTVLEVGCSTGETTRMLAKTCKRVVAVDVSNEVSRTAAVACADLPNVTVARIDGRDTAKMRDLAGRPDLIFADIGGNASLDNITLVVRFCLRAFSPRIFVIRNDELAEFHGMVMSVEAPEEKRLALCAREDELQLRCENLLELSRSINKEHRAYAARRLRYVDLPEAAARLAELAEDPHPKVKKLALRMLGKML